MARTEYALRVQFVYDDEAVFQGRSFREILVDDIIDVLSESRGAESASELKRCLSGNRWSAASSQGEKVHRWSFGAGDHIEHIAKDLGFTVRRPIKKDGNPAKTGYIITV